MLQTQHLIKRELYLQQLRSLKDQNIIKVITGVRRCGKSTLMLMFADEIISQGAREQQVQIYNFEDLDTLSLGDIYRIHQHIKERLVEDGTNYIFLDEVQNIPDFQRLIDSLFIKPNVDVYVTGSNAFLLSGELATLLTGRYIEINLLPLQFSEYYDFIIKKSPNLSKMRFWRILFISAAFQNTKINWQSMKSRQIFLQKAFCELLLRKISSRD